MNRIQHQYALMLALLSSALFYGWTIGKKGNINTILMQLLNSGMVTLLAQDESRQE